MCSAWSVPSRASDIPLRSRLDCALASRRVFLNLVSNASDAIPDGAPSDNVIRAAISTDTLGRAVVEILDSGCRVAHELASRVFDAFFTTKPMGVGTGLGLAICHRIVGNLGGELTFESAPGATTFRVALPPAP